MGNGMLDYIYYKMKRVNKWLILKIKYYRIMRLRHGQYTSVLERVYQISSDRICHIHGGLTPYCKEKPILGR